MRLFIAVSLDYNLASEISKWSKEVELPGKKVETKNLHFTLCFLGERPQSDINLISNYVKEGLKDTKSFWLSLKGVDTFSRKGIPQVVFLKAEEGVKDLIELEKIVASSLPLYTKDKPFKPHLTISRLKEQVDKSNLDETLKMYKVHSFGRFLVKNVILFSSNLQPSGPVYKAEAVWKLVD